MTCPPCTNDCNEGRNCPARSKSQEPVAWHYPDGLPDQCTTDKAYAEKVPAWTPMYYKHEWVGLTDDEVELYWDWEDFQTGAGRSTILEMVRDIEAKLKEKNG